MNILKMKPVNSFVIFAVKPRRIKTLCTTILNAMKANSLLSANTATKSSYKPQLSLFTSLLATTLKKPPTLPVPSALIRPLQKQTGLSIISENTALMKLNPSGPPLMLLPPNKTNAIAVIKPATVALPTSITSRQMDALFALLLTNKTN